MRVTLRVFSCVIRCSSGADALFFFYIIRKGLVRETIVPFVRVQLSGVREAATRKCAPDALGAGGPLAGFRRRPRKHGFPLAIQCALPSGRSRLHAVESSIDCRSSQLAASLLRLDSRSLLTSATRAASGETSGDGHLAHFLYVARCTHCTRCIVRCSGGEH